MRRTVKLAVATIAAMSAMVGIVALTGGSASAATTPTTKVTAPASAQRNVPALSLRLIRVPLSAVPARTRAALPAHSAAVTPNAVYVAELVSDQYGKCVDANNAGSTAGQNGDKVQLWGCFNDIANHPNQWWLPAQTTSGYTELVNWQFGLCLDADNSHGFVNGAKVQLWGCFNDSTNHPNQWWNYGPAGGVSTLPSLWGGGAKVLDVNDAGSTAGQNGDKIQVWQFLGGANQFWAQ